MKTLIKAALAATVATGLFAAPAFAQNAATAPFIAKAKIMKPLTLVKAADLDFGTITMGAALTSANVVVDNAVGEVAVCGANLTCSGPSNPASFDVTGVALQSLNVTVAIPVDPGKLVDASGNWVGFALDAPTSITLDPLGARRFYIGGTITVAANTADGVYDNDVNVTVTYQ